MDLADLSAQLLGHERDRALRLLAAGSVSREDLGARLDGSTEEAMDDLVAFGLVTTDGKEYVLNRDHLLYAAVEPIVRLRSHLCERVWYEMSKWGIPPAAAFLDRDEEGDRVLVHPPDGVAEGQAWRAQVAGLERRLVAIAGPAVRLVVSLQEPRAGATVIAKVKLASSWSR